MELSITKTSLASAATVVARGIQPRQTKIALSGVKIEVVPGSLTLTSFDGDTLMQASAPANVKHPGVVLVPGASFIAMIRQLDAETVTLKHHSSSLELSCGTVNVGFPTMNLADYPPLPAPPDAAGTIDSNLFGEVVTQVIGSAERDTQPGALSVALLKFAGSEVEFTTTDKYCLAWRKVPWKPNNVDFAASLVVSVRALNDAARLASTSGETTISWDSAGKTIGFSTPSAKIVVQTQAHNFPDCSAFVEIQPPTKAVVSREALLNALQRASVFTTDGDPVKLSLLPNQVTVSVQPKTTGAKSSETLVCQYQGDPIEVFFAPGHLIGALRAINTPEVRIGYTGELKPVVVVPTDSNGKYRHVLMPRKSS